MSPSSCRPRRRLIKLFGGFMHPSLQNRTARSLGAWSRRTRSVMAATAHVPGVRFVHGDVTDAATLPNGQADLVYARCLLAHLPDVAGAIATWRAWLAPDGRLVLEEPERIDTGDPVFRSYLAATADAVAARGATMLAGPLVDRATAGMDGLVRRSGPGELRNTPSSSCRTHRPRRRRA